MTTVVAISDLHLVSRQPKAKENGKRVKKKFGFRKDPLVIKTLSLGIGVYDNLFNANLRPHTSVDEFIGYLPSTVNTINKSDPDLVVGVGDIFDLSEKVDRDTAIHSDVFSATVEFKRTLEARTAFLQGNADVLNFGYMEESLTRLGSLSSGKKDWSKVENSVYVKGRYGNFALKTKDVLIVGINSTRVTEYDESDDYNRSFLKSILCQYGTDVPVFLFTHHPPFSVLPGIVVKILRYGVPAQMWITELLKSHAEKYKQSVVNVAGHCHKWQDSYNGPVREICLLPMMTQRNGSVHIGSLFDIKDGTIQMRDLQI